MMVFRIIAEHRSEFVMWVLNSRAVYGQALQDVTGATAPHVNISTIKNYYLALPDKREQEAVITHIEVETTPISRVIDRLEREIGLLCEYRTRLIADVVTGKLDVREAAARLPAEPSLNKVDDDDDLGDEPEPVDEETAV
jgi:type I restriction enzyme S subunit